MTVDTTYEVLADLGNNVEIRAYENINLAETVEPDENRAFMALHGYISGVNEEKKQIDMTVPVITGRRKDRVYMAFILPQDLEEPPKPVKEDIKVRKVERWAIGTVTFTGLMSYDDYERERRILVNILTKNKIEPSGEPLVLRYDRPETHPLMQRVEIAYEVDTSILFQDKGI